MIVFDIETIPSQEALESRQWKEFKEKHGHSDNDAGLFPAFGKVICICAYNTETKEKFKSATIDEGFLIAAFFSFVGREPVLAGHNIKGFDIPFLALRGMANNIEVPSQFNTANKKPWEILHIDTAELSRFGGGNRISLDACCLMFGIDSPKEGEVNANSVYLAAKENRMDDIISYCSRDVQATLKLIKVFQDFAGI